MTIGHPLQGGRFFAAAAHRPHTGAMRGALLVLLSLFSLVHAAPMRLAFDAVEPWKRYDEQGRASGAYVEIVRELARRTGTRVEVVDCPLKRCLMLLQQGEVDVAIGLQATPEREKYLRFLATPYRLHASDHVYYMRMGEAGRLRGASDLVGLAIGVKLGSEISDSLASRVGVKLEPVPDNRNNFAKLVAGRIDAVAIPEDQGEYLLADLHLQGRLAKAPYREPNGSSRSVAVARRSPYASQIEALDAAMAAMRADGTLQRIYQAQYYDHFGIGRDTIDIQ